MLNNKLKSLTILYLIESANGGGAEMVVSMLAANRGAGAHVATLRSGWIQEELARVNVPCTKIAYPRRSDMLLVLRIAQLARQIRADVIHCNCFTMNIVGALAAALARKPSVGTVHGVSYDLDSPKRCAAYAVAGRIHKKMVTVSQFLRSELHNRTGIPDKRIEVIYNGVPFPADDVYDRQRVRSDLELSEDDFVVCSVGMLRPEKGHSDLLHAFAAAIRSFPAIRLVLVGDGRCRDSLQRLAADLGIADYVRFALFREDVPAILHASDLFVLPSHIEGLSIATIEAMVCKTPVIVTDCGGPREIVTHLRTGVIVPPQTPEALASAIIDLALNQSLRKSLAFRAYDEAVERFGIETMTSRYDRLYEEVAGNGGAHSG